MASILEDAYYKYREQGKTAVDLGEVIRDLMQEYELPAFLDGEDSQVVLPGKRQPTMGESIVASLERYHFMEQLEGTFGEKIEGIVVGGSMSYGPFFNVRDGEDSSDIDAIMVADDTFFDDDEWRGLTDSAILTEEDKALFLARKKVFEQLYKDGEAKVFSQRFTAREGGFNMSAHIMPREVFESIFGSQLSSDMEETGDIVRALRDYKPKRFERPSCDHVGFDDSTVDFILPEQEAVEKGIIATIPAYIMKDRKYYPGLYQCLALPSALMAFDRTGYTTEVTERYSKQVQARLDTERQEYPDAELMNAYPRKAILAPGRYN